MLRSARYPYEHSEKDMTIGRYAIRALPPPVAVGPLYQVAESAIDAVYALYMRVMADLAHRAEVVETNLGLPATVQPEESA
jgi:hypothetical protein